MKNTKYSSTSNPNLQPHGFTPNEPVAQDRHWGPTPVAPPRIRTTARDYANPVDYEHPYPSMARFADFLALHRSDHNRGKTQTLPGVEFVRRYLRHVLPTGLRSLRYYGFCHPAAKAARLRVQLHSGTTVHFGHSDALPIPVPASSPPPCPKCGQATHLIFSLSPWHKTRAPPCLRAVTALTSSAA